jgi:hypothetical protein
MNLPALLSLALASLVGGSLLNLSLAERRESRPYDVLHVPNGAAARIVALGHRTFLSDLYWLQTVQYIGEPKADQRGWDKLYPLVDLVTDLDPRHGYAYQTAGVVLSAAGRLAQSNQILEKGMVKGPPLWTLPYYLSFNHWFYMGDYAAGAEYARVAAKRPGASVNVARLALSLSSKSGSPEDAIAMIQEMRANVKDEVSASALDEQLKLAIVERDAQALERAIARFVNERGRRPANVEDLLRVGYVQELPKDPFGGKYVLDDDGKVRSSANPFRFQLREGQHAPEFQYQIPPDELRRMPE